MTCVIVYLVVSMIVSPLVGAFIHYGSGDD